MRIIQFLNWDYNNIVYYLDYVKKQNFDTIQINPVQPFINKEGNEWWASYQPLDFRIGNKYGTKEDLIKLCKEAKKRDIKIVVDVITNHLANDGENKETIPNRNINKRIKDNKDFFKKHTKFGEFKSYKDIIEESIGLPGLNLKNKELQDIIINFLTRLKDCGVSGFRFDAAKHIGLPSDGVDYFKRIKEFLEKNDLFAYGEFLDGPNDISSELTNTIYNKKNELSEIMYILTDENSLVKNSNKKVTFVESHDTYLNDFGSTKDEKTETIIDRYVELTKKYPNTIYYVRDLSYGKTNKCGSNRAGYSDIIWINNEKIRLANLNKGNEEKNIEKKEEEKNTIENRINNLVQSLLSLLREENNILITSSSTTNDLVNIVLNNYKKYSILCTILNIYLDETNLEYFVKEFYKDNYEIFIINKCKLNEFYKMVLITFKEKSINKEKIKRLVL